MTSADLVAIVDGLVPTLRELFAREVTKAVDALAPRVVDLETKAATPPSAVVLRIVAPWADGVEYHDGDYVAIGATVYCCTKTTTVKPDTITRNKHGDVRGPQGKDFWALVGVERSVT